MEEAKFFDAGLQRERDGIIHTTMAPSDVFFVFGFVVLRIQNQQTAARMIDRLEKRQPLDVVPMRVREKQREIQRTIFKFLEKRATKRAQTGAGIQNDDLIATTNFHAGSIAAVTHGSSAWC